MVDDCDYLLEELDDHLKKSTRSYQDICMRLSKVQKPGDAIHLIVSAASLMLNIPLLMVYPVQTQDKHAGCISYEYKEMASCSALSHKIWSQYPIKLIYNGIDHYFAFINDKIGLIANLGNPVVTGLNELCQETVMNEVPDNTTLKAGLNEIIQHMKVAQKVGKKLSFTKGTLGFNNEPTTEPPEVPDTSPVKSIKLRKHRRSISDEKEEAEGGEKEGDNGDNDGNQGGEKGEKASVEEQGEPAAKKKKIDCERADEQCFCRKKFETVAYLNKHIQRKHKTTWMCSGSNWIKPVEGEEQGHWEQCREVCAKRSSLWSHFRRKHEGRYHHYCLIGNCQFGSDEEWNINMHCFKKHDIQLPEEQKCPKCGQGFG